MGKAPEDPRAKKSPWVGPTKAKARARSGPPLERPRSPRTLPSRGTLRANAHASKREPRQRALVLRKSRDRLRPPKGSLRAATKTMAAFPDSETLRDSRDETGGAHLHQRRGHSTKLARPRIAPSHSSSTLSSERACGARLHRGIADRAHGPPKTPSRWRRGPSTRAKSARRRSRTPVCVNPCEPASARCGPSSVTHSLAQCARARPKHGGLAVARCPENFGFSA